MTMNKYKDQIQHNTVLKWNEILGVAEIVEWWSQGLTTIVNELMFIFWGLNIVFQLGVTIV